MEKSFNRLLQGYREFRDKYAHGDKSIMQYLSFHGQQPNTMVVACCDSRVDPALILQCDPGDLFVVRNVANIVPPFEKDEAHHGTSAALEFGIRFLHVKHLILLGHSQCGGIQARLNCDEQNQNQNQNDFISNWVSILDEDKSGTRDIDDYAKLAIKKSYQNCLTFPWIKQKVDQGQLAIHLWYFDIKSGHIFTYSEAKNQFLPLDGTM